MVTRLQRRLDERGVFLIHAVILVTLLALGAAFMLQLNLGRAVVVNREANLDAKRLAAESAEARVMACLNSSVLGNAQCNAGVLSGAETTCLNTAAATAVNGFTFGWAIDDPDALAPFPKVCRIRITVN